MITSADLENELNPQGLATKFKVLPVQAVADRSILNSKAMIQANLPERYRRMQRIYSGLVLSREAMAGQTDFPLPSWLTVTSGRVWRNLLGTYRDRKVVNSEIPVSLSGNVVLSAPAQEKDVLVGDFVHDGSFTPQILKNLCLQLAANEMRRAIPSLVAESDRGGLDSALMFLRDDLKQLRRNELRIDEWDDLDLVAENETINAFGSGVLSADGW